MPTPKEGESRDDFVKRCIPIVIEDDEDLSADSEDDRKQAVAICNSMWRQAQEESEGKAVKADRPMKKEKDGNHPAGHYLIVEDPEKPTTWHLRVRDINGDLDHGLMGAAWAALHQGYRGNRYEGPKKQDAIAKLRKLYKQEDMDTPGKSLAVKYLRDEDGGAIVGGPLLLWGSAKQRDLQGEYFTPETQTWHEVYKSVPALFHHGLDSTVGLAVIGHRVKAEARDDGLWVEDWLNKSSLYWKLVKPLLDAEALYYSPGSAPHLVDKDDDGRLKSFPIVEDTLTPMPAQHRLRPIEQIKAAYLKADLDYPIALEPSSEPETSGGESGDSRSEADRMKARAIQILSEIETTEVT